MPLDRQDRIPGFMRPIEPAREFDAAIRIDLAVGRVHHQAAPSLFGQRRPGTHRCCRTALTYSDRNPGVPLAFFVSFFLISPQWNVRPELCQFLTCDIHLPRYLAEGRSADRLPGPGWVRRDRGHFESELIGTRPYFESSCGWGYPVRWGDRGLCGPLDARSGRSWRPGRTRSRSRSRVAGSWAASHSEGWRSWAPTSPVSLAQATG
jgi:hypothetical protein